MTYKERVVLYEQMEKIRKRPLITLITSIRPNASGKLATDIIPEFIKQIQIISEESEEIDLLVVSDGGDPTASLRIVSILREAFKKLTIFIPYHAYSAATLIALGCDEIYMHPFGNLGPVDPQVTLRRPKKNQPGIDQITYSAEDIQHYLKFLKEDVGISNQNELERGFSYLCDEINPTSIGFTKKSINLSYALGKKLLKMHMTDANKVEAIIDKLNSSFFHHGYPVGRKEAREIGLPIIENSQDIDNLIWKIWEDFNVEADCHKKFDPLQLIIKNPEGKKLLKPAPQIDFPSNISTLPPNIQQGIIAGIIQKNINKFKVEEIKPMDINLLIAILESSRAYSHFILKQKIIPMKMPNSEIRLNVINIDDGYQFNINKKKEV